LPVGAKVYAGGHDQTVGAVGAGVVEDGSAMYATGTVECICPVLSEKRLSRELREGNLCCYDYTLRGKYTTVAYSLTGGNILQWFKNEFGQPETGIPLSELTARNTGDLAVVHPKPERVAGYDAKFAKYKKLYPALKTLR